MYPANDPEMRDGLAVAVKIPFATSTLAPVSRSTTSY
jgi:hypothetical protein